MKRLFLFIFAVSSLLFSQLCIAQRLKVTTFEIQPKDLSARTNPRADNSGQLCALLKIYVMDKITEAQGNVMGEIIDKGVEKWIYVSDHTKQIKLNFENHFPLMLTFSDYDYPVVSEQMVYVVELEDGAGAPSNMVGQSQDNIIVQTETKPLAEKTDIKESSPVNTTPTPKKTSYSFSPEGLETLEKAKKKYDDKDYDKAFWLFMKVNMNPESQYYLGQMYYYGWAVPQNRTTALEYYTKSANQGFAAAKRSLAGMYLYGEKDVVKADVKKALALYHEAAEQGNAYAQYNLGWMYATGTKVKKNVEEGVKWYRMAAAQDPSSNISQMAQDALEALGY